VLLAEVACHTGQAPAGLAHITEALHALQASARGDLLAEAYRLHGECLLRQAVPEVAQAEAAFQQTLTIARCQHAKAWELRAALSLGRLWQQQGRQQEVCAILTPLVGWFTEGGETADLQDARGVLDTGTRVEQAR